VFLPGTPSILFSNQGMEWLTLEYSLFSFYDVENTTLVYTSESLVRMQCDTMNFFPFLSLLCLDRFACFSYSSSCGNGRCFLAVLL